MRRWSLLAVLCLLPATAGAQLSGQQALSAADALKKKMKANSVGGELMFGQIGEDFYLSTLIRLNFDREDWGVGFGVPLRFRLFDAEPKGDSSIIRSEDWDDPADFLRIIRYVYVGDPSKTGPFYARIGELAGVSIGHGTIVHRFSNGFDIDRFRLGLNVAVNAGAFGGEAVIGDMIRLEDPSLTGFRLTVRPLTLAMHEDPAPAPIAEGGEAAPEGGGGGGGFVDSLADRFVVGFSLMVDPTAPLQLAGSSTAGAGVQLDERGYPIVQRNRALPVVGIDFGYELLRGRPLSITPYIDLNKITYMDGGWGFHIGVLWGLQIPVLIDTFTIDLRTEYRRVSGDYVSPYFDAAYIVERLEYPPGSGQTKLNAVASGAGLPGKNGVFFDILAGFPSYIFIGGEFIDYDGGFNDGTLRLSLEVPALEIVHFSAFYYRVNLSGFDDLFALDDRSAIVAEAQIPIGMFVSANLRWWRIWKAVADGSGAASYESVDDWSVGVGLSIPL